jgi:hypothetical protein
VDEVSAAVCLDEVGVLESPQVLGHGSRRDGQQVRQGSDAERTFGQQMQDAAARVCRQRPEKTRQIMGLLLRHAL